MIPTRFLNLHWSAGIAVLCLYTVIWVLFYRKAIVFYIANFYHAKGQTEKSKAMFLKAVKMKSKDPRVYANYSVLLLREGKAREALDLVKIAETLELSVLDDKNIRLTKGSCYWVLGKIDDAIKTLEELKSKYDYVNQHVLSTLGYMYLIKGDLDKAMELSEKAIEDTPESSSAWDNKGQIYYRRGDFENAKQCFEKAVEYKAGLADSLYYLGLIAEAEKDFKSAAAYYEKTLNCKITALNTIKREDALNKLENARKQI